MAVVRAPQKHVRLLAQLIMAEALSEGQLAMSLVGNVGVNRIRSNCSDFKRMRTIPQMVYQRPGGYESVSNGLIYKQSPGSKEMRIARSVVNGTRYHPAEYALWFFKPYGGCPGNWYGQPNVGRYKSHCFFRPSPGTCPHFY